MGKAFDKFANNLADYLENYREKQELTQADFAIGLDISLASYRRIITDPATFCAGMAMRNLETFAKLENYSLAEFVALLENKTGKELDSPDARERKLLDGIRAVLNDTELHTVLRLYQLPVADLGMSKDRWLYGILVLLLEAPSEEKLKVEQDLLESFLKRNAKGDDCEQLQRRMISIVRKRYVKNLNCCVELGR